MCWPSYRGPLTKHPEALVGESRQGTNRETIRRRNETGDPDCAQTLIGYEAFSSSDLEFWEAPVDSLTSVSCVLPVCVA
jgi:hypothetical protein